MRTYHVAVSRPGSDCHMGGEDSLTLHARRDRDCLPCEIWAYYGERETTKARLYQNRAGILAIINREHGTTYKHLLID